MKNATNQYKDLKEGKMSQANFMRNMRMTFPHLITNVTSFDDSVKILKNKGLLNEVDIVGQQIAGDPRKEKEMKSAFTSNNPFDQGKKASLSGAGEEENPYEEDTQEYQNWLEGWMSGGEQLVQQYGNEEVEDDEELMERKKKFDPKQLEMGTKVEKEHTKSTKKAKKIATDHLKEKPDYYTKLKKAGLEETYPEDEVVITGKGKSAYGYRNYTELSNAIDRAIDSGKISPEELEAASKKAQTDSTELAVLLVKAFLSEQKELRGSGGIFYKEINSLNAQEVLNGIDWEMENNHELSKEEAEEIVIKKLKKNPFYYTYWDMAGVEGAEDKILGNIDPKIRQMKPFSKDALIDKDMGMKPVKGFEKAKASAAKANKETNKGVKGVKEMTHNTKSVRGVKRMAPTGGKMKKINVKEAFKVGIKKIISEMLKGK